MSQPEETLTWEPTNHYTAEDIEVLQGLEAVRRRPGMYIGSTDQRGLHQLVYEIVYNSIDEAMAGSCNRIEVTLLKDCHVRVADNGRGIPVEIHPTTHRSALETVLTFLHAGAKFGGQGYKVSSGLHGVGASVVNALSSQLKVEVRREGKIYLQEYRHSIPQGEVSVTGVCEDSGTTITFEANPTIFTDCQYDFNIIAERLRELAYLNKGLEIYFKDERADEDKTFYFEGGIASLVRSLNKRRQVIHESPIYIPKQVNSLALEVALQYHSEQVETSLSFANCVNTIDGGTHLSGFRAALTRVLNDYAQKNKLLKEEDRLLGDDVRIGLTSVVNVKLHEPQFEGQTKAKLGNLDIKSQVETAVADELAVYLERHPDEARAVIEKAYTSAKAREAARKARELIFKKSSLDGGTLPGKLAGCSERNPYHCEIFLVEGDSAGGSAKQGRDRRFQAILPLKGKILNVQKSPEKMLEHEEIRTLVTALGANLGQELDLARLRYNRVIIMTDADVDGAHIRALLLTFFFNHMSDLIHEGHLFIAQPPLYRISNSGQQHWVYSDEEKEEVLRQLARARKVDVQRYKGLGEMSPQQLWDTTLNPDTRTLLQVNIPDAAAAEKIFHMLMGSEVQPRKEFIQAHARSVRNLDI
jgi:DNA gyrase subunit B